MKTITQGIIHHLQEGLVYSLLLKSQTFWLSLLFLPNTYAAVEEGTSSQQFENKCKEIGYSKEVTDAMTSVWISQAVTVASSLLQRAMTNNQLVDMDWIFGVTASSDDFNHVGKTFLQLKLTLAGSECSKVVLIELSLEQFYQFLASMEKCKSYLDYVLPPST